MLYLVNKRIQDAKSLLYAVLDKITVDMDKYLKIFSIRITGAGVIRATSFKFQGTFPGDVKDLETRARHTFKASKKKLTLSSPPTCIFLTASVFSFIYHLSF